MLHNEKLADKGRAKRDEAAYGSNDNTSNDY